ncbi:MAG: ABC transporter permease [Clostridia bacterium]|nr:ABC transporter permease [Clostridia bacterium]MCR5694062.1 ABC transporter permease [Clostridia bacterium]
MSKLIQILIAAIVQGIPLLYGATGEIITEKSGNLNLGIPGIMYVGGISGIIGGYLYERSTDTPIGILLILIPLLSSLLGSLLMALIYSFLTITLRANQNVTGLALTTFGVGVGNFFGGSLLAMFGETGSIALQATGKAFRTTLPFAHSLGPVGELFFSYGFLAYLAVIIAIAAGIVLNKTRVGLNLKAVGENPATADAAGINVTGYKYFATCLGGMIAGLGGLYWVMDFTDGAWTNNGFGDRGWLAIAIVIFAIWRPYLAIPSAFLFGGLYILSVFIPGLTPAMKEVINMLPYFVTIVVLVTVSARKKRENLPPGSLGLSYFREER